MICTSAAQAASWGHLGHVVQQGLSAQRGALLGAGFYAHTEGWAVLRAGQGLLLTTAARAQRGTSVASSQMDAAEAAAALRAAQALSAALGDAAQAQASCAWAEVAHAAGAVADSLGSPHAFGSPHLVVDAAASQSWATPGPLACFAGQHAGWVASGDVHVAAAHTASVASGSTLSLYTHSGPAQAIAATGALSVRAHTGSHDLLASQNICATSSTSEIHLQANQRITLTAGHSQIELNEGNITFSCPGTFTFKAAAHDWNGGSSASAELPLLPSQSMRVEAAADHHDQFFVLRWANSGRPMKHQAFRLRRANGSVQTGTTDEQGRSPVLDTASQSELLTVEVLRQAVHS